MHQEDQPADDVQTPVTGPGSTVVVATKLEAVRLAREHLGEAPAQETQRDLGILPKTEQS